jgi:hypothetical protein
LNWQKLAMHSVRETLWAKLFNDAYRKDFLNESELEMLFSKSNLPQTKNLEKSKPENQVVTFLKKNHSSNLGN